MPNSILVHSRQMGQNHLSPQGPTKWLNSIADAILYCIVKSCKNSLGFAEVVILRTLAFVQPKVEHGQRSKLAGSSATDQPTILSHLIPSQACGLLQVAKPTRPPAFQVDANPDHITSSDAEPGPLSRDSVVVRKDTHYFPKRKKKKKKKGVHYLTCVR